MSENQPKFTDQYYRMNIEEDDLLFDGTCLLTGMKVLIEENTCRINPAAMGIPEGFKDRSEKYNRWCVVGVIKFRGELVEFIGLYEDGTKRKFTEHLSKAWYVKKDTYDSAHDVHEKACQIVTDMIQANSGLIDNRGPEAVLTEEDDKNNDKLDIAIEEAVAEIVTLFN